MAYTVQQLAELSGVTVRTLHHYDAIGLLSPAYYGSNNYRYYEEEQLLMLQQILVYRLLDMPLDDIKAILQRGDFDKVKALKAHKAVLNEELNRISTMIMTLEKTIKHLTRKTKMKDEEMFYGLDSPKQKRYEKYLVEKGVCTAEEIKDSRASVTQADMEKFQKEGDKLYKDLAEAIQRNLIPASPEVQKLIKRNYEILKNFGGTPPTKEYFVGLTQQYSSGHPDWNKFFNHYHPRLRDFLCDAMLIFADRELS